MLIALAGCGGGAKKPDAKTPGAVKPKAEPDREIFTQAGDATRFSDTEPRTRLWTVKWQTGHLRYASEGNVGGNMEVVSGSLYKADKVVSTFKAEKAVADEVSGQLTLEGSVEVHSTQQGSTLRSDRVIWASKGREIVKAEGKVSLESKLYTMGDFPALWASPDLSKVATPEDFDKTP